MAEDWSPEEVAATVADYFAMLDHELRGEPYNKKDHNRRLQQVLRGRSSGAIEFKHANISAVLIELGFPYIDGYKPRGNYQELLKDEVSARLDGDLRLARAAEAIVQAAAGVAPAVQSLADTIVPAPIRERDRSRTYERLRKDPLPRRGINYLEREANNASLGAAGEVFALDVEHRRLWEAGERRLAERIEHVSRTRGDGLGYDIHSFDLDGRDRLIEVKTTSFGAMTPFFASNREVAVSEERAANFKLYRVFKFREAPKVFVLSGALRESCVLDAVQFRVSLA
ncbi:DUF3883 domain-containing protein [Gemmatimonas sp.]|uniref:DUF3883 domain-containing protein n=1 Tax=Gemmatimonas sp. TaxID=1962908 RepID=UPI0022C2AC1C|nr:DUF3883 domain-containing protein [Gemmatimonas sp.]MCZ8205059.1 DUF3883 domain-containing protein [Gemmatimonas sp.]